MVADAGKNQRRGERRGKECATRLQPRREYRVRGNYRGARGRRLGTDEPNQYFDRWSRLRLMREAFRDVSYVRIQVAFWTSVFWFALWIVLQTRVFFQDPPDSPSSRARVWVYRVLAGMVCLGALNYLISLIGLAS